MLIFHDPGDPELIGRVDEHACQMRHVPQDVIGSSSDDHAAALFSDLSDRVDVVSNGAVFAEGLSKQTVSAGALMIRSELPSYYTDTPANPTTYEDIPYIDSRINAIPEGKHWLFFTDTHWDWGKNAKKSPMLIEYITQRAGIKNVIFGGDFINRASNDGNIKGRFLANQIVNDFGTRCISACGDGLLPVMGNHDNNLGRKHFSTIFQLVCTRIGNPMVIWCLRKRTNTGSPIPPKTTRS